MSIGALAPNSTMLGGASIVGGSGPGARAVAGGRSRTLLGSAGGGGSGSGLTPTPPRERGPSRPGMVDY
jgi:hypothetical protein